MSGILEPEVTFSIIPAAQLAGVQEQKALVVGQLLSGGTASGGGELLQDLSNNTAANNALFGRKSHLAGMVRAFKRENEISRLDAIVLDDAGGATAGTAVFTITGGATEDGTIDFVLGSEKDHKYSIDNTNLDTPTIIGDALVAAITADLDAPFTAANVAGVVTATSTNKGTLCNDWDIRVIGSTAGVAIALTGWTGGATDPTLTSIFDVIGEIRYQTIIWPSAYDLDVVETLLNARFNSTNQILDGVCLQLKKGTLAQAKTYADQNSPSIVVIGNQTVSETSRVGTMLPEMPDISAAEIGAVRALRFTESAPLTDYLTTVAPNDQFGGIAIASLPYFNTVMPNLPVPNEVDQWSTPDMTELRNNGVSVVGGNRVFSGVILGEFVTTYLTNGAGNPDTSYKFLNTVDTASVIREYFYENSRARYAQTRLTAGDLVAGRDMANESSIRAFCNRLYGALSKEVLVQAGSVAQKDFDDNLVIVTTVSTGTATITMAPLLVSQLRAIIGTIQINFGG